MRELIVSEITTFRWSEVDPDKNMSPEFTEELKEVAERHIYKEKKVGFIEGELPLTKLNNNVYTGYWKSKVNKLQSEDDLNEISEKIKEALLKNHLKPFAKRKLLAETIKISLKKSLIYE